MKNKPKNKPKNLTKIEIDFLAKISIGLMELGKNPNEIAELLNDVIEALRTFKSKSSLNWWNVK